MSPRAVAAGLLGTLALGVWLRWFLAGVGVALPGGTTFPYLRHAHSHLGYYAVLVPLGWLAWERSSGRAALRRWERWLYAAATVVATVGFVQRGYGILGIVGSTLVGALWLLAAWRIARSDAPIVAVLPGTVLALACIPLIATSLRSDPAFAAAAVQTFLTALLFLVVAPSAVSALGLRERWPWATVVTGALSALALGLWPTVLARVGLGLHALSWLDVARRIEAPVFALPWLAAALGLLAVASGVIPLTHDVAIGAIHFLVLGPFVPSLTRSRIAAQLPPWAWWIHHGATAALAAPLLLRGAGWIHAPSGGAMMGIASAIGGSALAAWWLAVLARRRAAPPATP